MDYYINNITLDEAFSKENLNRHLTGNGEVIDIVYNQNGTSAIEIV